MLIDTHAHLSLPQFDKDRTEVIKRARDAGIKHIITVGTDSDDCRKAVSLAQEHDFISAAVGIHPHDVKTINAETYSLLRELAADNNVVAIGEIGLDFYRNLSLRETQLHHFREQMRIAREISRPVVIHDREAHQEVLKILQQEKAKTIGGVIHCFSGDWEMAKACLDMGFYISIPGTITYKKSEEYHKLVRDLPLDRMLVETDCPFLAPHPFRGKRNEPAYVKYVAEAIARIKGIGIEEVAKITTQNAQNLFNLVL
ncbi:MAG: TatD family hydrolase [Thermodesulfobacteriota bacterium]|jgi:TatD DNase family protein|nr:MAG: TatD family hydrolase [Thermodesulfobacteriota bacterium]